MSSSSDSPVKSLAEKPIMTLSEAVAKGIIPKAALGGLNDLLSATAFLDPTPMQVDEETGELKK